MIVTTLSRVSKSHQIKDFTRRPVATCRQPERTHRHPTGSAAAKRARHSSTYTNRKKQWAPRAHYTDSLHYEIYIKKINGSVPQIDTLLRENEFSAFRNSLIFLIWLKFFIMRLLRVRKDSGFFNLMVSVRASDQSKRSSMSESRGRGIGFYRDFVTVTRLSVKSQLICIIFLMVFKGAKRLRSV